jgi:hypothetical protein
MIVFFCIAAYEMSDSICMMYRQHHTDDSYHWITDFGNPLFNSGGEYLGNIQSFPDANK